MTARRGAGAAADAHGPLRSAYHSCVLEGVRRDGGDDQPFLCMCQTLLRSHFFFPFFFLLAGAHALCLLSVCKFFFLFLFLLPLLLWRWPRVFHAKKERRRKKVAVKAHGCVSFFYARGDCCARLAPTMAARPPFPRLISANRARPALKGQNMSLKEKTGAAQTNPQAGPKAHAPIL